MHYMSPTMHSDITLSRDLGVSKRQAMAYYRWMNDPRLSSLAATFDDG